MRLWMSVEADSDVADAYRAARAAVEKAVNNLLQENDYGGSLVEWTVIPIITRRYRAAYPEVATLSTKQREAEFRLHVSHANFKDGTDQTRRSLLFAALIKSIEMMPSIGVRELDVERLLMDVTKLARISDDHVRGGQL
jgi:hypothetical protein